MLSGVALQPTLKGGGQLKSDRLGVHKFGLQPAEEAEQKQQQCGAGGRQHLGKKKAAKGI